MPRTANAAGFGGSQTSQTASTRLLSSAHSCAQRAELSLETLSSASNLLLLVGVGAGLVAAFLSGLMIDDGMRRAAIQRELL